MLVANSSESDIQQHCRRSLEWHDAMRKVFYMRFSHVLIVTMPLLLLTGLHIFISVRNFTNNAKYYPDVKSLKGYAREAVYGNFQNLLAMRRVAFSTDASRNNPENLFLDVDAASFEALSQNLPESGETRVKALLNGQKAKLSLRGSSRLHWLGYPKSLRLRTPKKTLFKGRRNIVFSVKQMIGQHEAYRLADAFDLMSPDSRLINLFINGKFYSTMHMYERIDDMMLKRIGVMPGSIYSGENFAYTKRFYSGVPRWLFRNPHAWSITDGDQEPGVDAPFMEWASILSEQTGPEDLVRLESTVSTDYMARYLALKLLCNDFHMDSWHNQRILLNPFSGRFYPVVWDTGIHPIQLEPDVWNPVFPDSYKATWVVTQLIKNPEFMSQVMDQLDLHIRRTDTLRREVKYLETLDESYRLSMFLARDKYNGEAHYAKLFKNNADQLERLLSDCSVSYGKPADLSSMFLIQTEGHIGAQLKGVQLSGQRIGEKAAVHADRNLNGVLDDGDELLSDQCLETKAGWSFTFARPQAVLPGYRYSGQPRLNGSGIHAEKICYPFLVSGLTAWDVTSIQMDSVLSGRPVLTEAKTLGPFLPAIASYHPWTRLVRTPRVVTIQGPEYILEDTLILRPEDSLTIEPGTTVKLGENVSILAQCRVDLSGTKEAPISFVPLDAEKPYGVVALQGAGANGSQVRHARFEGGSHAWIERIHYTGMLTVYDAEDITISDCELGRNYVEDDALRAGGSKVDVVNCVFKGSRSDAVDFDFTEGSIMGCRFENIGNDAIDLMTCNPTIRDNVVLTAGDKGVSVGNESYPRIVNNHFKQCAVGVEIKDSSDPLLVHNVFDECEKGVQGYLKNWRYDGGGRGRAYRCVWTNNTEDIVMQGRSSFHVYDSDLPPTNEVGSTVSGKVVFHTSALDADTAMPGPYREVGISSQISPAGLLDAYSYSTPQPLWEQTFRADFSDPTSGWQGLAGIRGISRDKWALKIEGIGPQIQAAYSLPKGLPGVQQFDVMVDMRSKSHGTWIFRFLDADGRELGMLPVASGPDQTCTYGRITGSAPARVLLEGDGAAGTAWIKRIKIWSPAEEQAVEGKVLGRAG